MLHRTAFARRVASLLALLLVLHAAASIAASSGRAGHWEWSDFSAVTIAADGLPLILTLVPVEDCRAGLLGLPLRPKFSAARIIDDQGASDWIPMTAVPTLRGDMPSIAVPLEWIERLRRASTLKISTDIGDLSFSADGSARAIDAARTNCSPLPRPDEFEKSLAAFSAALSAMKSAFYEQFQRMSNHAKPDELAQASRTLESFLKDASGPGAQPFAEGAAACAFGWLSIKDPGQGSARRALDLANSAIKRFDAELLQMGIIDSNVYPYTSTIACGARAASRLGEEQAMLEKIDQAQRTLQALAVQFEVQPAAFMRLATARARLLATNGNFDQAVSVLRDAQAHHGAPPDEGSLDDAFSALREAMGRAPGTEIDQTLKPLIDRTVAELEVRDRDDPKRLMLTYDFASNLYAEAGSAADAIAYLDKLAALAGDRETGAYSRAALDLRVASIARIAHGDTQDRIIARLQASLASGPLHGSTQEAVAWRSLEYLLRERGRLAEAKDADNEATMGVQDAEPEQRFWNYYIKAHEKIDERDRAGFQTAFRSMMEAFKQGRWTSLESRFGALSAMNQFNHKDRRYDDSMKLAQECISALEKQPPGASEVLCRCYSQMGSGLFSSGQCQQAEGYFHKAIDCATVATGGKSSEIPLMKGNLGALYLAQRRLDEAASMLGEVVATQRTRIGDKPVVTSRLRGDSGNLFLTLVHKAADDLSAWTEALTLYDASRRTDLQFARKVLPFLALAEQFKWISANDQNSLYGGLDIALAHRDLPGAVQISFEWLTNAKERTLDAMVTRRQVAGSSAAERVRRAWSVVQRAESDAVVRGDAPVSAAEYEAALATLAHTSEQTMPRAPDWIDTAQVRRALGPGAAFIQLALVHRLNPDWSWCNHEPKQLSDHYVAWVVTGSGPVVEMVDLGEAEPINAAANDVYGKLHKAPSTYGKPWPSLEEPLNELSRRIWVPLAPLVKDSPRILVSPDGPLWMVPWEMLKTSTDTWLVEQKSIGYLLSGRELAVAPSVPPGTDVVLVQNPQGDQTVESRCFSFPPLSTTGPPNGLRDVLRQIGGGQLRELGPTGAQSPVEPGTPRNILSVTSPKLVYLNTHSRVLDDNDLKCLGLATDARAAINPLARAIIPVATESGGSGPAGNSIITASEIAGMNLTGTRQVILSACDTGGGVRELTEGVNGLRKAVHAAGADLVVSSAVPLIADHDALLVEYLKRVAQGTPEIEALAETKRAKIRELRKRGASDYPYKWAPLILSGNPGVGP